MSEMKKEYLEKWISKKNLEIEIKKYLREFDGQVLEQNIETCTTFFQNWH